MARSPKTAVALVCALVVGVAAALAAASNDREWGLPDGARALGAPDSFACGNLRARGQPFGPGERCRFTIEYGPVKAGTATMEVLPMVERGGRTCYHLASTAQSAPFFDSIYRVRDRIDTMVDAQRFVTYQYQKVQNEGGYHAEHKAVYDPVKGRVRYSDGATLDAPLNALDVLSAFYRARIEKLTPGLSIYIPHHSDRKSFYLEVHVVRKEKIDVPAGSFSCVVVEPLVRDAGPFKNKGALTVWLTDDARHLPVLMKSKVPVGSVDAVLQSYTLGGPTSTTSTAAGSSAGL
ncbi:MAG TPA: DUF3108 domain-containing protein [Candidatus Eisenbacteria bacterium]|nr:DUF3108 domain-containing protein [Candidatus Eisenbacteria bacterium]